MSSSKRFIDVSLRAWTTALSLPACFALGSASFALAGCSGDPADMPDRGHIDPLAPGFFGGAAGTAGNANAAAGAGGTSNPGAPNGGSSPVGSAGAGDNTNGPAPNGGAPGAGPSGMSCATYEDDFLPKINPVCSTCHNASSKVPNWGIYATALASCSLIGSRVASGAMPPPRSGATLTAADRALVADWVRLACPQTMSDLPSTCFAPAGTGGTSSIPGAGGASSTPGAGGVPTMPMPSSGGAPHAPAAGGTTATPPAAGTVAITRAEWDASKQTLRLEGTSSNLSATLTAEFGGRTEALTNAAGRFRAELTAVTSDPVTVTVHSSTGAQATANVLAK